MIEARDVVVEIEGRTLLDGVSLEVGAGRVFAVAGRNGAGKSTLLSVVSGLRRPTRGAVLLEGRPLTALTAPELARRRAVLRQQDGLTAPLLAREVVALGRHPHGDGDPHGAPVARAMEEAEIAHLADRIIGTLSGGERQRVQLARVLAQLDGGGVLLLDEPTSALDLAWQHRVLERVRELARTRNLAVLAVLHDLNLAACFCDELLILRQGRQVARGAPEEVLTTATVGHAFDVRAHVLAHPDHGRPQILVAGRRG